MRDKRLWTENEAIALVRANGRVVDYPPSDRSQPASFRLYAEFIRCNGERTTRTENVVFLKDKALWASSWRVFQFDEVQQSRGEHTWFQLTRMEKLQQWQAMGRPKGIKSLTEPIYKSFCEFCSSRAAEPSSHEPSQQKPCVEGSKLKHEQQDARKTIPKRVDKGYMKAERHVRLRQAPRRRAE
ncbi:hypothetical protein PPTG_16618 [Phytophthora nicotianae INRA-310]|uniref:Uncharacterized protein n=1 Tax=Phytophthora nicotianae (strain INRA-310) TaxID=761204 RepID=W2PQ89_PHYN3|nr:hypothetical protein PPTG_16618 [Phytophthora nicotianae INRA-310]ETN02414.1 hypothetical protein PPTG_16618 [Phytophthora nicotianae INRA-310]